MSFGWHALAESSRWVADRCGSQSLLVIGGCQPGVVARFDWSLLDCGGCAACWSDFGPFIVDGFDVFGAVAFAPEALADDAGAVVGEEGVGDAADGLADLLRGGGGEEGLAVDLAPEADAAGELFGEVFDGHAEELGVDGVDADLDEIGDDVGDISVGVHEDELAVVAGEIAVVFVEGLEEGAPQVGVDQEGLLRAPVVDDVHGVDAGVDPQLHLLHEVGVDHVAELVEGRLEVGEVHVELLGSTQVLHAFEGVGHGGPHGDGELVGGTAGGVDLREVGAVEDFPGRGEGFEAAPVVAQGGVFDFTTDAVLGGFPDASPDVGVRAIGVGFAAAFAGWVSEGRIGDVAGVFGLQFAFEFVFDGDLVDGFEAEGIDDALSRGHV